MCTAIKNKTSKKPYIRISRSSIEDNIFLKSPASIMKLLILIRYNAKFDVSLYKHPDYDIELKKGQWLTTLRRLASLITPTGKKPKDKRTIINWLQILVEEGLITTETIECKDSKHPNMKRKRTLITDLELVNDFTNNERRLSSGK